MHWLRAFRNTILVPLLHALASSLVTVLKTLALPPLNLIVLGLMGWWLRHRWPRLGRGLMLGAGVSLYFLSTPYAGGLLLRSLQTVPVLTAERFDQTAGAIVILSGDLSYNAPEYNGETVGRITLERLRYGVRLFHTLHLPVLVSGGRLPGSKRSLALAMQEALVEDFRVPVEWLESRSQNTYENARFSAPLLHAQGIRTVYLVTHAAHMLRAQACFAAFGITTIAAPTHFATVPTPELGDFLPTASGLNASHEALYEWIGRLWYRLRYY
jgi:uncharacterized SAM-binding protein YcdF (DUF218 family)